MFARVRGSAKLQGLIGQEFLPKMWGTTRGAGSASISVFKAVPYMLTVQVHGEGNLCGNPAVGILLPSQLKSRDMYFSEL